MFKLVDRYPDRPATELARSTENGVGSNPDIAPERQQRLLTRMREWKQRAPEQACKRYNAFANYRPRSAKPCVDAGANTGICLKTSARICVNAITIRITGFSVTLHS